MSGVSRSTNLDATLAQPAEVQNGLYPSFVCLNDELALEFDDAYHLIGQFNLTKEQLYWLDVINELLNSLSKSDSSFESKEAHSSTEGWNRVRQLARDCLVLFGWPLNPPPVGRAAYVKG